MLKLLYNGLQYITHYFNIEYLPSTSEYSSLKHLYSKWIEAYTTMIQQAFSTANVINIYHV